MKKYKHIYFDLDRTLWDFESNSEDTFRDILKKYDLLSKLGSFEKFLTTYRKFNDRLWHQYRDKLIEKKILSWKRFYLTLLEFGINDIDLSKEIGEDYLTISKTKKKLFPFTHEILRYLHEKYSLHIITNGFEEVQFSKLDNCNLRKYFTEIITSEKVGVQKPNPEIFEFALHTAKAKREESLMIGDDVEVDIKGAMNQGIDQVHFNFIKQTARTKATYEITSLIELKEIL
ncbi:YjjG family noncanonical pyrimidine nucleotidase [Candidatus Venteria ishoeyi]|uniref:Pyrimidine 5'-nucleotidase YjjG n=1 Tax=Candidatus Venteria ishoeyi TaxID=1899563 RepID=A0A1H6F8Q3_9GAMM|nr:YjjG family noncanonical pyrimidine nucleotidase [Candidatus Venteria ishoeyi]SEH05466.1 Pyrimidine 5'-nucleotidase YjjG [Candidatus Venteria ishoeyi]